MARSRGGQPGNINAIKHGFYSRRFMDLEAKDLETVPVEGLEGEIALMRVMIRRVFDYANDNAGDLEGWTGTLSALGAASTRLASIFIWRRILIIFSALYYFFGMILSPVLIYFTGLF